jgi:stage III sporulation protein AB
LIKFTGLAAIGAGALLLSIYVSNTFKRRIRQLELFQLILSDIINTLKYSPVNVSEMLAHYTQKEYAPFDAPARNIIEKLNLPHVNLTDIWKEEFNLLKKELNINESEYTLIIAAGEALALNEREKIIARLNLINENLNAGIQNANKDQREKGNMYRKLILLGGAFLIVLLI